MPVIEQLRSLLSEPWLLGVWLAASALSVVLVVRDLGGPNRQLGSLMKLVWVLTTVYSGPLGLAVYSWSGRRQIPTDDPLRRGARSTAHCYSGCGLGEALGVTITVGILAAPQPVVVAVTFGLAYLFGILLTVGPLLRDGATLPRATRDAVISETASIVAMETVAIGVDQWLAGDATMSDVLFWTSLSTSLTLGFLAAYPVNLLLVRLGVKEGMMDPRTA